MKNTIIFIAWVLIFNAFAIDLNAQQDLPNDINSVALPGNAGSSNKFGSTPINIYTGMPNISIPIYHYEHHNGISLNVSLDYFPGGVKVNESPGPVGINWYLNAGGAVTRTIRGMPDDLYPNGYMYASALPSDSTINASQYYHDSLDAELDVFQFMFNGRSGRFFIGKNKQIRLVPLSKLRIAYDTANGGISQFRITAEDGVKYVFSEREYGFVTDTTFRSGYNNINYTRAWYLSQVIAPFGTDTIRLQYNTIYESGNVGFPQSVYFQPGVGYPSINYPIGNQGFYMKKPAAIIFPDKKNITFVYDNLKKYDTKDSVLNRIKIGDTVFRYGYLLDWGCCKGNIDTSLKAYLAGIRYFTQTAMMPEYSFTYSPLLFSANDSSGNIIYNDRDHWGYYNGAGNGTSAVPGISGVTGGANRAPSSSVIAGSLNSITDPSGGITYYQFEPNDIPQYSKNALYVYLSEPYKSTQHIISLSSTSGNQYTISINYEFVGNSGIPDTCLFSCTVTSIDGKTTYGSLVTSYKSLRNGMSFSFNAPNGIYMLNTGRGNSCSCWACYKFGLNVFTQDSSITSYTTIAGGLRLKQQSHYDPYTGITDTIATYNYVTADGKSSGFISSVPIYYYPYQQRVINGSKDTTTNYTLISSDPINTLNYTQGSPVGYSRVEVIKGSAGHNLGKEVYEFTSLSNVSSGITSPAFPYAPSVQADWKLGLPKRVSVFDSSGRLVNVKLNNYTDSLITDSNANFQSRKFGRTSVTYYGDPANTSTPRTEYFRHVDYFPMSGVSLLKNVVDSFYHPDNSVQADQKTYQYDTNLNVNKITSNYDLTRGLSIESRIYYPYNYTMTGAIGKLRDSGILNVPVATESWITGDANPRMIAARIMDFVQLPKGQIKPYKQYALQTNNPVPGGIIGDFNPSLLIRNSGNLVLQTNYLAYDSSGNPLAVQNAMSGLCNSVIMDYFNTQIVAKVSNAAPGDIAYTSFESDGTGGWTIGSASISTANALTGKKSYNLSAGSISRTGLNPGVNYLLSVWCYSGASVSVNGNLLNSVIAQQNNWSFYQINLSGTSSVTISGTGYIDELRLHPKDANMVTSTYEPLVGITSTCDANNTVQYRIYDVLNRPQVDKDKDFNILKKYQYGDSISSINIVANWQNTGLTQCDSLIAGQVDRVLKDINPMSETYGSIKLVADHSDCGTCKAKCPPGQVADGCTCSAGTRINVSSSYNSSTGKWTCGWRLCYSNGTTGPLQYEYNSSPCTITPGGCTAQ